MVLCHQPSDLRRGHPAHIHPSSQRTTRPSTDSLGRWSWGTSQTRSLFEKNNDDRRRRPTSLSVWIWTVDTRANMGRSNISLGIGVCLGSVMHRCRSHCIVWLLGKAHGTWAAVGSQVAISEVHGPLEAPRHPRRWADVLHHLRYGSSYVCSRLNVS